MPVIGGRFYANPAFGEALERARAADAQHAEDNAINSQQRNQQSAQTSPVVRITYSRGIPPMEYQTEVYLRDVLIASGIRSANISSTTNGEHAPNSWHPHGQAVDINRVNDRPVREASSDLQVAAAAESLQRAANHPSIGVAHENYGPQGLFKGGRPLDPVQHRNLQMRHNDHIHLTIPNPRRRDASLD